MRYLSQVFQSIRMEVNDEIGELQKFLERLSEFVKVGGRVVVISFHSLEDRMVRNFFRRGNVGGVGERGVYGKLVWDFEMIAGERLRAGGVEIERNKRSRSAKMRIAKRKTKEEE